VFTKCDKSGGKLEATKARKGKWPEAVAAWHGGCFVVAATVIAIDALAWLFKMSRLAIWEAIRASRTRSRPAAILLVYPEGPALSAVLTFALQGSMRAIIARTARICLPSRVK
jgi:chorismate-pyruvate lyase